MLTNYDKEYADGTFRIEMFFRMIKAAEQTIPSGVRLGLIDIRAGNDYGTERCCHCGQAHLPATAPSSRP